MGRSKPQSLEKQIWRPPGYRWGNGLFGKPSLYHSWHHARRFQFGFSHAALQVLRDPDAWIPLSPALPNVRWLNNRGAYMLGAIGCLKTGISLQRAQSDMKLVVRTAHPPLGLAPSIRKVVQTVDTTQPVTEIQTMEDILRNSLLERRILMAIMGVFAGFALILVALGGYGILSYFTSQRTQEFGIRMALGAKPGNVLRMVMKQGMGLVVLGIALGLAAALAMTRLLSNWLFGVTVDDPVIYAAVIGLLAAVALLACYLPARQATHVDPILALRYG